MLRMANHMVDSYLDAAPAADAPARHLQSELLDPKSRFGDWKLLLDARNTLHMLEDTCEDQRSAMQEWIDALDEWPTENDAGAQRERELLRLRSRDVLEHIERVLTHVRRLEHSAEIAVQMHFSALGHRTNDIMRTLTVLTAIFLPLNLITGFFGMNFDSLPLIHSATGIWTAHRRDGGVGVGLIVYFRRKRYLGTHRCASEGAQRGVGVGEAQRAAAAPIRAPPSLRHRPPRSRGRSPARAARRAPAGARSAPAAAGARARLALDHRRTQHQVGLHHAARAA